MAWIVFDFAGVLGHHQQPDRVAELAERMGAEPGRFVDAYWAHRALYDAGEFDDVDYWERVASTCEGTASPGSIDDLVRLDVASWLAPNTAVCDLSVELQRAGHGLALLSNAPLPLAAALDELEWLGHFDRRFYSSRMRMTKPSPEIYRRVASEIGVPTDGCVMVDDRADNIVGAERAGMRGVVFVEAAQLRAGLAEFGIAGGAG